MAADSEFVLNHIYFMATNNGVSQPILCANPKSEDWVLFKRQFGNYLLIVDAATDKKLPFLLNSVGRDGYAIYDGLAEPKAQLLVIQNSFKFVTTARAIFRCKTRC